MNQPMADENGMPKENDYDGVILNSKVFVYTLYFYHSTVPDYLLHFSVDNIGFEFNKYFFKNLPVLNSV